MMKPLVLIKYDLKSVPELLLFFGCFFSGGGGVWHLHKSKPLKK